MSELFNQLLLIKETKFLPSRDLHFSESFHLVFINLQIKVSSIFLHLKHTHKHTHMHTDTHGHARTNIHYIYTFLHLIPLLLMSHLLIKTPKSMMSLQYINVNDLIWSSVTENHPTEFEIFGHSEFQNRESYYIF